MITPGTKLSAENVHLLKAGDVLRSDDGQMFVYRNDMGDGETLSIQRPDGDQSRFILTTFRDMTFQSRPDPDRVVSDPVVPGCEGGGWRGIEEHDGSLTPSVIVCAPVFNGLGTRHVVGEARFKGDDGWWWENTDSEYGDEIFPTHYQPLPPPPEGEM